VGSDGREPVSSVYSPSPVLTDLTALDGISCTRSPLEVASASGVHDTRYTPAPVRAR
jgi:hypothetical protein